jgi:hypothetical protein
MVPSLVHAAFLVSVVSTITACVAARAADNCLNEPKHQTPPGRHWYYRIDNPNHRKCWFLGDEGLHVSHAGSPRPSASSSSPPLPQQPAATIQPSLTDAHAEVTIVKTPTDQPPWSRSTEMSSPAKITEVVPDARPSEALSPPGDSKVMRNGVINGQSRMESRTELLSTATDREPAAEFSAEETSGDPLRARFALLLIVLGLSTEQAVSFSDLRPRHRPANAKCLSVDDGL